MDLSASFLEELEKCKELLADVDGACRPLLSMGAVQLQQHLPPLERARAYLLLAKALVSVFSMYLDLTPGHLMTDLMNKEKERLQQYTAKLSKAVADQELSEAQPAARLNVGAASRFISAAIPDLTPEQRQQLKQAEAMLKRREQAVHEARQSKRQRKGASGTTAGLKEEAAELLASALRADIPEGDGEHEEEEEGSGPGSTSSG